MHGPPHMLGSGTPWSISTALFSCEEWLCTPVPDLSGKQRFANYLKSSLGLKCENWLQKKEHFCFLGLL